MVWKTYYLLMFVWATSYQPSFTENTPQSEEILVSGLKGGSITFLQKVPSHGGIATLGGQNLATVFRGQLEIFAPEFEGRLDWDHETGLFSLHHLRLTDTGRYTVENSKITDGTSKYKLAVYGKPSPNVVLQDPISCVWACSVKNYTGVTLAWYREDDLLNFTSNPDNYNNNRLPLLLNALSPDDNFTYYCKATNPAINQTEQLSPSQIQTGCRTPITGPEKKSDVIIPVVLSLIFIAVVIGAVFYIKRRKNMYTQAHSPNEEQQNDLNYSEIIHKDRGPSQGDEITSVYVKIQPHSTESDTTYSQVEGS